MGARATFVGIIWTFGIVAMADEEKGIIARSYENGLPVILRLVDEIPQTTVRGKFKWLTVMSWKYDGTSRNGMPERTH